MTAGAPTDRLPSEERREVPDPNPSSSRWFGYGLSVLVLAGIIIRLAFAISWTDGTPLRGDPLYFQQTATQLARGHGYVAPFFGHGKPVPTALHPPVFSFVLAILDIVGIQSPDDHRVALAFIASGGIVAMGFLGRRLLSPAAGLISAGIAALSPQWFQASGKVLSESVYLVIIPVMLLLALRCIDRPSGWRFFGVGVAIGLAALTRSEALTFILLIGVPLVAFARLPWRERTRLAIVLVAGFVVVVGPWIMRNDIKMGGFTISTDSGTTLSGAYTAATFAPDSPLYGSFNQIVQDGDAAVLLQYAKPPHHAKSWTELTLNNALGHIGTTYARKHLSDLPGVVLAREGRLWGIYDSGAQLKFDLASDGDGVAGVQVVGQYLNWVLIPLVLAGIAVLLKRSRRDLTVTLAPILAAALSAAATFGSTRYRSVAEPSIAVLAAVAVAFLGEHLRRRGRRGTTAKDAEALTEPLPYSA